MFSSTKQPSNVVMLSDDSWQFREASEVEEKESASIVGLVSGWWKNPIIVLRSGLTNNVFFLQRFQHQGVWPYTHFPSTWALYHSCSFAYPPGRNPTNWVQNAFALIISKLRGFGVSGIRRFCSRTGARRVGFWSRTSTQLGGSVMRVSYRKIMACEV